MTAREAAQEPSTPITARRIVNLGILGLGPRWRRRYATALRALPDRFRVRAVCDAVQERADHEARALGCTAAAGPTELLEHPEVEAVLLLDAAWYRLWPLELACRVGKPVLCAVPLDHDDDHADGIQERIQERGLVVVLDLLPQLEPITRRVQQLLAGPLGTPQLVLCEWAQHDVARAPAAALLGWCAELLGATPSSVTSAEAPAARLASVLLEFPDGRAVQLVYRPGPRNGRLRVQVVTAHGQLWIAGARRVQWTDTDGRHGVVLPRPRPAIQVLLERFYRAVTTGLGAAPDLERARRSLAWLRAVARSKTEGRKVQIE
jgi:predicted dehydrogenase